MNKNNTDTMDTITYVLFISHSYHLIGYVSHLMHPTSWKEREKKINLIISTIFFFFRKFSFFP